MTLFIQTKTESIVQVDDKTRIDISKTFISGLSPSIDTYEVMPSIDDDYVAVTDDMFLDWVYESDGTKTITVRATDDSLNEYTKETTIEVISVDDDNLFSKDSDILPLESDLLDNVQDGRNSFLDKHRAAQTKILDDLDSSRIWKNDGDRYEAADIVDIQEFTEWSKYLTLRIIFEGLSNSTDDVFSTKAGKYRGMAIQAKKRATLRLDGDGDGTNDTSEQVDNLSGYLVRR